MILCFRLNMIELTDRKEYYGRENRGENTV